MKKIIMTLGLMASSTVLATESNYDQVYLKGTFNNWDNSAQMSLVADHVWEKGLQIEDNSALKFDINGDWSVNFGDNNSDEIADAYGSNIQITNGGYYRIQFNDETKQYALMVPVSIYFVWNTYPVTTIAGLPLTIEQDGQYYASDDISYSTKYGNWLDTYLPAGHSYTVALDAATGGNYVEGEANRYQGSVSFTAAQSMLTQNVDVVSCGAAELRTYRSPADGGESAVLMECKNGVWFSKVDLNPKAGESEPRAVRLLKGSQTNPSGAYGDDNLDGVLNLGDGSIKVEQAGEYDLVADLNTLNYSMTLSNAAEFEAHAFTQVGCWLELRGNKLPLSWYEGTHVTLIGSWLGGPDSHFKTSVSMQEEGEFEYKYTRVCTGGSLEWEQGANRSSTSTGVAAPQF